MLPTGFNQSADLMDGLHLKDLLVLLADPAVRSYVPYETLGQVMHQCHLHALDPVQAL